MTARRDRTRSAWGRRQCRRIATLTVVAALALAMLLGLAGSAMAASVSGRIKGGRGYRVVLVQANGLARKAIITTASGAFRLTTRKLAGATLSLVKADGSFFGPVVLKASPARDFCTIKGRADLRLGTLTLKRGYALARRAPRGRYDIRAPYVVTARSGRPIGAGKAGRVRTGTPAGYQGAGGDLDRDGVVGAFDIDDNGNLILDNVDTSGRGGKRPLAGSTPPVASRGFAAALGAEPPPPAPGPTPFHIVSNFRLPGGGGNQDARVNASIPGVADLDGLIAAYLPGTLLLFMPIMDASMPAPDGTPAELDGLGNSYFLEHQVAGVTYPLVERSANVWSAGTHTGALLDLVASADRGGDAFVMPGALPAQIGSGDAFVEVARDGTQYPGVVNFVFNTVPALASYRFGDAAPTAMVYDAAGVPANRSVLSVPPGAKTVTLTWWRPQRTAAPGEAGTWIDMGGLSYDAPLLGPARTREGAELPGTHEATGAYVSATSNGTSVPVSADGSGIVDPARDAPADAGNTVSVTLSLEKVFSDWASFGPGTTFELDLEARTAFGDLASSRVSFVLE
jgi:hypothetical protein